jgi:cyclic pyranopterin phosphate synthase
MAGKNTEDIIPMAGLTKDNDITVRFIEEMPFNGAGKKQELLTWNHKKIREHLQERFPDLQKVSDPENSTAFHYRIAGHKGVIGIIAAYSRTFCGTCNRIRVTAQGTLKTCLYDDGVLNIKQLIRSGLADEEIKSKLVEAFSQRAKDGFEAEANRKNHQPAYESMSTIGG